MTSSTLTVWLPQNRAETQGPAFTMVRATYPKAERTYPDWVWVRPIDTDRLRAQLEAEELLFWDTLRGARISG